MKPAIANGGSSSRIHYLDNLRAVAMMLGIVIHAGVFSATLPNGPWRLHESSDSLLSVMQLIHSFRMQLFFLISGFFSAMVVGKIGLLSYLVSRTYRIIIPLVLSLIFLAPIIAASETIDLSFKNDGFLTYYLEFLTNPSYLIKGVWPTGGWFYHFWFLQFLAVYVLVFSLFRTKGLNKIISKKTCQVLGSFFCTHFGLWVLIFFTYLVLLFGPPGMQVPGAGFSIISLLYFGIFFYFGSIVFERPRYFEDSTKKFTIYLIPLLPAFLFLFELRPLIESTMGPEFLGQNWTIFSWQIHSGNEGSWSHPILDNLYNAGNFYVFDFYWHSFAALRSFTSWITIFLFISLFIRFFNKKGDVWRYVSDSSYWVYIIHFPIQHFMHVFVFRDSINSAPLVFLLHIVCSSGLSFISYHYLVRSSLVGVLLNGKKHNPKSINYDYLRTLLFCKTSIAISGTVALAFCIFIVSELSNNSKILNLGLFKDKIAMEEAIKAEPGISRYSRRPDGRNLAHMYATKNNNFWFPERTDVMSVLKMIETDGTSLNSLDDFGCTPLHYAVRSGNVVVVESLCELGVDLNIANRVTTSTPLHYAASSANDEIIKILIRNGADVSRVNKYGKTPLENYTKFATNPDSLILKNLGPHFILSSHLKEI
ncbi:MAG: hypothetical protein CMI27_06690 [Opitutae bacterium]|nr:hypothetical protein [Opitutae bacterium]|tara:strand:+ start:1500 stop:3446 length:1947 start_codon:yes stop_codon:yes gene_type:complete